MASSNSYMKNYMLARYHKRMSEAKNKLGGKCFKCNSIEDLQLDHINPQTKNKEEYIGTNPITIMLLLILSSSFSSFFRLL